MVNFKRFMDQKMPKVIERLGRKINPLLLNYFDETNQLLVFYFHGIYASPADKSAQHVDPQNNVTIEQFEDFIEYFQSHQYEFVTPQDVVKGLPRGGPYLMMTFDDGYFNNALALGSLEKYRVPATFFITARNVLYNKSYWWDIIYKYRRKEGKSLPAIRREQDQLKKLPYLKIDEYVEKHFGKAANQPWSDIDRPFSPSELAKFAQNPYVEIGNHTFHHTILTRYDEEQIRSEFLTTNASLKEMTGITPISVAFPNGNYDQLVLKVAKQVGFKCVFTIRPIKHKLPLKKGGEATLCLHRFMTRPERIREYGGFCRLGYHPGLFYEQLKDKALFYRRLRLFT